ncbi:MULTISPECIES: DUF4271 domain-containing protein [unclassified Prevotella]|uniref:DUF4271 domain-containing protein n=1 Tax=unclassified Prevotella TaxID=2638335 RepID=UPI00048CC214|nr:MULTISPECIES: DUF4271 domain-containing protein [unclassified Prevotella]
MLENDSILTTISTATTDTVVVHSAKPQTPYEVLRLLPKDATPAQQDSAIQEWFEPKEIHYSSRPDTLHLPGQEMPRDLKEVSLPHYYRENFFSNNAMYHPELSIERIGVSGAPIPYTIQNDSIVTGILIVCFLLITYTLSRISGFLIQQTKHFFSTQKRNQSLTETGSEIKFQFLFLFITCQLYALLYYFYTNHFISNTFVFSSEYTLLVIYGATILGYMLARMAIYSIVNNIFFDSKKNLQFQRSILLITSLEGVALFPLVLLLAYFMFSLQNAIYYTAIIVILAKILTFYKSFSIFFKQKGDFLQIILYFCALEMMPLMMLWSGLLVITENLKINI